MIAQRGYFYVLNRATQVIIEEFTLHQDLSSQKEYRNLNSGMMAVICYPETWKLAHDNAQPAPGLIGFPSWDIIFLWSAEPICSRCLAAN